MGEIGEGQEALIDWGHLSRQTGGDAAFADELLGLFAPHAAGLLERLGRAAIAREWRDAAHSLKGSARGIGAFPLGQAAEVAEALPPESEAARAELGRIADLLARTLSVIERARPLRHFGT